jgi:hypothetical protein
MAATVVQIFPDALRQAGAQGTSAAVTMPAGTTYVGLRVRRKNWVDIQVDGVSQTALEGRLEISNDGGETWHGGGGFTATAEPTYNRGGELIVWSGIQCRLPRFLQKQSGLLIRARLRAFTQVEGVAEILYDDREPPVLPAPHNSVAYDNDAEAATTTANNSFVLPSFTVGANANRYLLIGVHWWNSPTRSVSTVTWDGSATSWTLVDQLADGANEGHLRVMGLVAPAAATAVPSVQFSGNVGEFAASLLSVYNVDQTTPTLTPQKAQGTGTTPSLTVSAAVGDMVADFLYCGDGTGGGSHTITAGAGQTERTNGVIYTGQPWGRVVYGHSTKDGAASVGMSWTAGGDIRGTVSYRHIAVPINEDAGGGGATSILRQMLAHHGG